jgi:predicted O-methyltransferase YrrM
MRSATSALAELGFAPSAIAEYERDYERVAPELFAAMLASARAVRADLPAEKLAQPELPGHEAKKLLYVAVRLLHPVETVVETGTYNGTYTSFILAALRDNGAGKLISFDLPAYSPIPDAIDRALPEGCEPGWIVPNELRPRLEIVLGDTRDTLAPMLARLRTIDLFLHDSLHTLRHMSFEYRTAWPALRGGGLLVSDDVFYTGAFWWFTRRRRLPFLHTGTMGLTRKQPD